MKTCDRTQGSRSEKRYCLIQLFFAVLAYVSLLPTALGQAIPGSLKQPYPTKQLRFIIPGAAGGIHDVTARSISQKLNEAWGQPVLVENRPGAAGIVATELGTKAPADGHTLIMIISSHTANPSLYKKLPYDSDKDFVAVSQLVSYPLILLVHPSLPVRSVQELIGLAKARPGELNYSSPGVGTSPHLAMELFRTMVGIKVIHIPYKGGPFPTTATLTGEVSLYFNSIPTPLPHIRSGRLRALAVTGMRRDPAVPDVPTVIEAGVKGYQVTGWLGLLLLAGTPVEIVNRLQAEVARALQAPDAIKLLANAGVEAVGNTSSQFAAFLAAETRKWAEVVRVAGVRIE